MSDERTKLANMLIDQGRNGFVCFMTLEGIMKVRLSDFIKQPAEGILYDLNRLPEVVLTFLDDPKWVNDYAVGLVITHLKKELDLANEKLRSYL